MAYSMKEVAQAAGMPYERVKYYCKIGLLPRVARDKNNYRVFDDHDLAWLIGLTRLRECGMSLDQMRQYMELSLAGPGTIPERETMMRQQRRELTHRLAQLQETLAYVDAKLDFYRAVQEGELEYQSNLLAPPQETG